MAVVKATRLSGSVRADRIVGATGSNEIDGLEGNDELIGGPSGDALIGGAGDDRLDGGSGADVARYRGSVFEYDLSRISPTQFELRHARPRPGESDGTDVLRNVERLDFRDRKILLDGSNNAPLARADEGMTVVDGRSLTIPFSRLLGNDVDFDGDRLTITQVKGKPADGVRIVGSSVVFTPPVGVQWALAGFRSYESPFLYTISDGRGGSTTASATVTILRPSDLRGLPTGPAGRSLEGAGGPGEPPGAVFTKLAGQSVTGTESDDLIVVATSGAMTGGIVDGRSGVDELRFTNAGSAQTLTLPSSLVNVERVVIGTGTGPVADTSGISAHVVSASAVGYGLEFIGNAGANRFTGTAFADRIDGGMGNDRMTGGAGNDTYVVDSASDVVTESSNSGGTDTVQASVSYTLPSRVENLELLGSLDIDATGNSLANTLIGNAGKNVLSGAGGADTLDGGPGADTMAGGSGNDTYFVDDAGDAVTEASGAGIDTVRASLTYTLGANVENLTLFDAGNIDGTGNGLANTITGNAGNNVLSGGSGVDSLIGGDGDDLLEGAAGNDTVDGGTGTNTARFSGARANYSVTAGAGGALTISDLRSGTPDGVDTVRNVSFLRFSDVTIPAGGSTNQPPIANDDGGFSTAAGTPITIAPSTLLANDTDAEGATLSVVNVGDATNGTVAPSGSNYVFTPATGFSGTATFRYQASDGEAQSAPATVSIAVGAAAPNEIVLENQKPGNPKSEWDVSSYDTSIQGYAAQFSSNQGETVQFKVDTDATDYRIDIYRLGYYNGDGARKVATVQPTSFGRQPAPVTDSATGLVDAGNWRASASWAIPTDAVSGVYIAKLVRESGPAGANHIPFVVRDDDGASKLLFQTSDTTWQAYNDWGGNSLYSGSPAGRAYKVSYNRPINTRFASAPGQPEDYLFDSEYPTIRWLEANGYDVSYFSGIDSDRRGAEIREHDVFLSVGHDEYWSGQQRANVEAARDAGVDLAFLSGNEVFWKTRWENSIDGSNTPYTTLVSYKETHPVGIDDPSSQATGTWRDPRFETDAGRPENALTGQLFTVNDGSAPPTRITVPAEDGQLRFWRNAGLGTAATTLASDILSYEWDEDVDNGSRPAGLIRLSSTLDPSTSHLQDFGSTYGDAPATHSLTMYRAGSSALVFGAGTTQWAWGLDAVHDGSSPIDSRIQQATVNLLADMGVQPGTLRAGLTPATASTDTTRPTSVITSPTAGSTLQPGTAVTITGTASDVGGRVGGVEVSTDGGANWRRASGRANWTYQWTPAAAGTFTLRSRAADDSLNLEAPGTGVDVTVGSATSGTFSLWPASTTPTVVTEPDASAVELGVKFVPNVDGQITGLRFYKGPQNLGTHVGNLWTSTGTRLASANFTNESASGWQQVAFPTPVPVTSGTTYVASYFAPQGRYSVDENYFNAAYTNGPLTAPSSGSSGGNGVYRYGGTSAFPNATFSATNYWVDVVFQTGTTTGNRPPNAVADAATTDEDHRVTINVLANDADPDGNPLAVTLVDLTGTQGTATINPDNTITYDPGSAFQSLNAGQQATDTFRYVVSDGQGATASAPVTVSVTGLAEPPPSANPIVVENQRPGTPQSVWGINGPTTAIEGFATDMSVDQGGKVDFKINTVASDYRIDIYRLGYYQGNGARFVTSIEPSSIRQQPAPIRGADGLVDAGNWTVSASWNVPTDAVSGVYVAHLVREDGTLGENHVYFVVRDDDGRSDMLFQTADTTWQAYNLWGGGNFYTGSSASPTQAHKVSYNRPFGPATNSVNVPLFDAEYPMIRWLEANGYNVSYSTGVDTDRRGNELLEHQAFLSVGHDEYWSGRQRANIEAARDAGVDLAFFSGNEVYWKTRWEDSNRTLVSYKETWSNAKIDPSAEWTGTWRDPRFSPPSDGGQPENRLTGTIFQVDSYRLDTIQVPAADGRMRFWRDTPIANLSPGQTATLTPNVLGYEWDEDPDNGFRPPGSIRLSTTNLGVSQYLLDYGSTTGPGDATHNLTLYRAPSGALVFGAGTTRWSWGLDADHINESSVVDPRMQQATVNLFADMGIRPDSLRPGLVAATASTDTIAPVSSISGPAAGTSLPVGQTVTITGTASDQGGRVGGVEVSVDDGSTWHPATGRENWSYAWRPTTPGAAVLRSRAIDDSLNVGTASAGRTVDVQTSTGPWSLFGPTAVPTQVNVNDPNAVELGVKFRSDVNASITALRFYKGSQDTGTHVGSLWTATGTRLATATFTNETASGWQQVDFATPVPIQAGQIYVASYHTPTGFYSADTGFFSSQGVDVGPLHAPASPLVAGGNGVFQYGAGGFPTNTWNGSNYWVDVVLASA